jgi:hypothetical protein
MTSAPVKRTRVSESDQPPPIALSEAQMCALLAASYPLPPALRSAFLEACAYLPNTRSAAVSTPSSGRARSHSRVREEPQLSGPPGNIP